MLETLLALSGLFRLISYWKRLLLYGSGLRLMECIRLRVKKVDFHYAQLTVRDSNRNITKYQVTRWLTPRTS